MTFNYKLVNKFLEEIFPLPEEFGVICSDYDSEPVDFSLFKEAIWNIDNKASIFFGMSKMVITSPNLGNVVIKIPFNGCYEEKYMGGGLKWSPFCWATGSDPMDYCLTEFEKYNRLKTYGLDCFVAKTIFYKKIYGVRVFLQEQIIPENNFCYTNKPSRKSQDLAEKWYDEGKIFIEPEWIANCLDKYGKSKVERFLYYCTNIDLDILEDMHNSNFGYRENGTPCILDYSNYNG